MPGETRRNIELKMRVDSLDAVRPIISQLADERLPDERQVDTYFHARHGRLKLREIEGTRYPGGRAAQLIWYEREDQAAARDSHYQLVAVADSPNLKTALERAWGIRGTVSKLREIFLYRNVRIHLDQVERLGVFLELEAVVGPQADATVSEARLKWLLERLPIDTRSYVAMSYADLLLPRDR